jgi:hypothetical protein
VLELAVLRDERASLERTCRDDLDLVEIDRLRHVIDGARFIASTALATVPNAVITTTAVSGIVPDGVEQVETGTIGHPHVGDDEIEALTRQLPASDATLAGHVTSQFALEEPRQHVPRCAGSSSTSRMR